MRKPKKHFTEELELEQLCATEQELVRREKEFAENRKRLVRERSEQERTIPPLEEVRARARRLQEEINVSRGEVNILVSAQRHGLSLLFLFVTATCALVWWGIKLMQGG